MTRGAEINSLTNAAEYAADKRTPSMYLESSDLDRAHRIGLWASDHHVVPLLVSPGRGHKMKLNHEWLFDFAVNETQPIITRLR